MPKVKLLLRQIASIGVLVLLLSPYTGTSSSRASSNMAVDTQRYDEGDLGIDVDSLEFTVELGSISQERFFTLFNESDYLINWDIFVQNEEGDFVDWLLIGANSEVLLDESATVTVQVDATNLDVGFYTADIVIMDLETEDLLIIPIFVEAIKGNLQGESDLGGQQSAAPEPRPDLSDLPDPDINETDDPQWGFSTTGEMAVDLAALEFTVESGTISQERFFTLFNESEYLIDWAIFAQTEEGAPVDELLVTVDSDELLDESVTVWVQVDASDLDAGFYAADLVIVNQDTGDELILPVLVSVLESGDGFQSTEDPVNQVPGGPDDPLEDPFAPVDPELDDFIYSSAEGLMVDVGILEFGVAPGNVSQAQTFSLYNLNDFPVRWTIFGETEDGQRVEWLVFFTDTSALLDELETVDVMVDATTLTDGIFFPLIVIVDLDTQDRLEIPVILDVDGAAEPPSSGEDGDEFDFGTEDDLDPTFLTDPFILPFVVDGQNPIPQSQTFTITTESQTPLEYVVVHDDEWVSIEPDIGDVSWDAPQIITVTVDPRDLTSGFYLAEVDVLDTNSLYFETILVDVEVRGNVTAQVNPASLSFEAVEGEPVTQTQTITVVGIGADALEWYAYGLEEWLILTYDEQDLSTIHVSVASEFLNSGTYTDTIFIESNGGTQEVSVTLTVESTAEASRRIPRANLEITRFWREPSDSKPGDPVTLFATITNSGRKAVKNPFYVDLFMNWTEEPSGGNDWRAVPSDMTPKQGIGWFIDPAIMPNEQFGREQSITLTSQILSPSAPDATQFYRPTNEPNGRTRWTGILPPTVNRLMIYVDSQEEQGKPNGRISESNEDDNASSSIILGSTPNAGSATNQLTLYGLEVTQAVQDLQNSVPLIAEKPTFVRAHVTSTVRLPGVPNVQARLHGTNKDGQSFKESPLNPINPNGEINVHQYPSRGVLNDSFLFELPKSWLEPGSITLTFTGGENHPFACDELGEEPTKRDCKVSVTFDEAPSIPVRFYNVQWADQFGITHSLPDSRQGCQRAELACHKAELEAQFPIHQLNILTPTLTVQMAVNVNPSGMGASSAAENDQEFLSRVLDEIKARQVQDLRYVYSYGVAAGLQHGGGWGYLPGDTAYRYFAGSGDANSPRITVHEFGHMHGLRHTRCRVQGKPEPKPDTNYPYHPKGLISGVDDPKHPETIYGFHIVTQDIIRPTAGDIMSYCHERWISGHNYERLLEIIRRRDRLAQANPNPGSNPSGAPPLAGMNQSILLVQGTIQGERAEIIDVRRIELGETVFSSGTGDYTVRTEDAGGQGLYSEQFASVWANDEVETFSVVVPHLSAIHRIFILRNNQELASVTASDNPPQVAWITLDQMNINRSEPTIVQWTASDVDGNELFFSIDYSTDNGSTWQLLQTGLSAISSNESQTYQATIDFSLVPGSPTAKLRIRATDGFYTVQDSVTTSFSLPNATPDAFILNVSGERYVADQLIVLDGVGFDLEDGELAGSSLTWSSTHDQRLGTGQRLELVANELSEGEHTITLTARDSGGSIANDYITLTIARDPGLLPAGLALYPSELFSIIDPFISSVVVETIRVDNDGDNGLFWAAEADQPWIELSQTAGVAPFDLDVILDADRLPPISLSESYTGTITFTDELSGRQEKVVVDLFVIE
ncbi:MAG: hypothetical protein AAF702_30160 [Chloroflexota bacterium]